MVVLRRRRLLIALLCAVSALMPSRHSVTAASGAPTPVRSLIAYQNGSGIGVIDPATGRRRMLMHIPGNSLPISPSGSGQRPRPFLVQGPVWGPSPGSALPSLYFSVYDARTWETNPLAHYGWMFRANPFTGSLQPLAVRVAVTSDGPENPTVYRGGVAFSEGCCQRIGVDIVPVGPGGQPHRPHAFMRSSSMLFLLGAAPSGRLVVYDDPVETQSSRPAPVRIEWLDPSSGRLTPFTLPPGLQPERIGSIAFTHDGQQAALALYRGRIAILHLGRHTALHTRAIRLSRNVVGLGWSPDGTSLAAETAGGHVYLLRLLQQGEVKRKLLLRRSWGISWSPQLPHVRIANLHSLPSPIPFVNGLLRTTLLPHTLVGRVIHGQPTVTVHIYPFDLNAPRDTRSIVAHTNRPLPPSYPSLNGWADGRRWTTGAWLLGGAHRYRVIVTSHFKSVAFTVALDNLYHATEKR